MKKRPFSQRRGIPVKNHLRFLRPSALARIRDTKLTSLSIHKPPLQVLVSPPSSPLHETDRQAAAADQQIDGDGDGSSPCFLGKRAAAGPACPQRKKLCAAKYVFFVPPPSPDVADLLGSDLVAAH